MLFASRERRGPDRYLRWKTAGLVIGVLLLLLANRLARPWLGWIAMVVLAATFALRFARRPPPNNDPSRT
jgi:hypothetical protein